MFSRLAIFSTIQMDPQMSLNPEGHLNQGNTLNRDGNSTLASSGIDNVAQLHAKKPTRQWAAWTHQEEESFFTALRQVGKNFEKITCRVQSKNKDQVRHYYYRLVRRMNKLLGPELSLDAKNPKDTNAAMLRWWSLLEKYSCKASKLHLKPRRFKLFIEALEHQLLKDRKKNVRKRVCQGENFSSDSLGNVSNQSRERGADNRVFKLILVDSQNIQKLEPGKGSIKHNDSLGVNHSDEKEDMTTGRGAKQRRKPGVVSSAAYRKWEKAAMAGVSLVADAAEHLERTSVDKDIDCEKGPESQYSNGKTPLALPSSDKVLVESNMQSAVKLKLQLFPIDDGTRRALEMGKHNPHLELTLSNRKKISSVLEHLTRKWGNSSAALGELMLFPYNARKEDVICHQRWTQDSFLCAADVHSMVGSPSLFRLRYGWFIRTACGSLISQVSTPASCNLVERDMNMDSWNEQIMESVPMSVASTVDQSGKFVDPNENLLVSNDKILANPREPKDNLEGSVFATNVPWNRKECGNMTSDEQLEAADDLHLRNDSALSAGDWADSLTNISVGDLLCEMPDNIDTDCIEPPVAEAFRCLQNTAFSCDSFDVAIAAHILGHQNKSGVEPTLASHSPSIWDDEETRDAFSFQKSLIHPGVSGSSGIVSPGDINKVNAEEPAQLVEELLDAEGVHEDPMGEGPHIMDTSAKTLNGLADVYWPDSLGPLDLDIRSSKYNSEDLILSDSLEGLSRLIASSLDAFQNCSLFGFDKKDQASIVDP